MHKVIVSDTSCLILLYKINRLDLLKDLFGNVTITQIVADEFGIQLPDFITIENPKELNYQKILETILDPGESSSIALALDKDDCLLILDDLKARKEAKQLKMDFTGTLGLFVVAKEKRLIDSVSVVIDEIKKTNFRIAEKYLETIRRKAGE